MKNQINLNKALMRRVYTEMWNLNQMHQAQQLFARPEGVKRFVSQFLMAFPDLHHIVEEIAAEGDYVVVRFNAKGTHQAEWNGFKATEKNISYSGVTWARIANGKIIEHETWWDKAGLIEQLTR